MAASRRSPTRYRPSAPPAVRRAQRTELALGLILGAMLIGIAALIGRYHIHSKDGTTVLAQVTQTAIGHGVGLHQLRRPG